MDERLLKLRGKLKEQAAAKEKNNGGNFDTRYFRHFLAEPGQSSTVRYLDDHPDSKNEFFWQEKMMFEWVFPDAENPGQTVKINIPCRNMYVPKTCNVTQMISKVYETSERAKEMWVNRHYLYQGFVRRTDIVEEEVPENPIRIFDLTKNLYTNIYSSITDEDEETALPSWPTDPEKGLNFIFKTTKNAFGKKDYSTSTFSNKPSPLTDEELAAIEKYGLYNLKELLPKQPSDEAYEILPLMAQAGLDGEAWDKDWEVFWKPYRAKSKVDDNTEETASEKPATKVNKPVVEDEEKAEETAKPAVNSAAAALYAKLEANRAKAKAAADSE